MNKSMVDKRQKYRQADRESKITAEQRHNSQNTE